MYVRGVVSGRVEQASVTVSVLQDVLLLEADASAVPRGAPVTFTASTAQGTPFEVTGWEWMPDGSPDEAQTAACAHTDPVCTTAVYEDGVMLVHARVGGEEQTAQAPVAVLDETLVVEMRLSRRTVEPVFARVFDADSQTWSDPYSAEWRIRRDLTEIEIEARWEPSGRPAAGGQFALSAEPVEFSGGHPHVGRPGGTFFATGDDTNRQGRPNPSLSGTLDQSGKARAVYRTSGVSGIERVKVRVDAEGQTGERTDSVTIMYAGLVEMPREGLQYYFTNQNPALPGQRHGNINNWADPYLVGAVLSLFAKYFVEESEPRFADGDTRFAITEASLPWGGLLDVANDAWRNPHRLHRRGRDIDVRSRSMNTQQKERFEELCKRLLRDGVNITCVFETAPEHYHIRMGT